MFEGSRRIGKVAVISLTALASNVLASGLYCGVAVRKSAESQQPDPKCQSYAVAARGARPCLVPRNSPQWLHLSYIGAVDEPSKFRKSLSYLVERTGIEPVTSWLQTRRSPS